MSMLRAIRDGNQRRRRALVYEVRVDRRRRQADIREFDNIADARAWADAVAQGQRTVCTVTPVRKGRRREVMYTARPADGGGDGSAGVREPRRPFPGSSAGSVELDLPE